MLCIAITLVLGSCAPKSPPQQGLRRTTPDHDSRGYWAFSLGKAEAVLSKGDASFALELLAKINIPEGPELQGLQARKELDQATAKYQLTDYSGAKILLRHAETLAESAHETRLRFNIDVGLANLLAQLHDWPAAEATAHECYRLASGSTDASWKGEALATLGSVQMRESHYEDALHTFEEYFEQQPSPVRSEDRTLRAKVLNNAAVCNYRLGELDTALNYYEQALALDRETGDLKEQSICLGNMGNIHLDRGEYETANRYFLQAARLNGGGEENLAKWLSNSARASIEAGDWKLAEQYNTKALEIKRRLNMHVAELYSLRNAARIAELKGDNRAAEALYGQVIGAESDDPAPALESQAGLAKLYAATGRLKDAEAQFQAALGLADQSRSRLVKDEYKLSYLDSLMTLYRDYVDFLMLHGGAERALEVAEASRARILCERLQVDAGTRKFTAAQYRQLAKATGSVLVSYWTASGRSYGWLITPDAIWPFTLPSKEKLASLVNEYRALIENLHDPLELDDAAGRELYSALVARIADRIANRRVILIPDGPLAALNFETLPAGAGPKHYLIEDFTISIAPALNLLAGGVRSNSSGSQTATSLLLIGDPDSVDQRFPRLPYAGAEMDKIAGHFQSGQVKQFRSREAVPAAYYNSAAQGFSFVHFTAHAIADRERPLDSAIVLSGSPANNKLTASDVMRYPLQAQLVTLSACRTAGARTYAGEGLVGFTWAFFLAGAHSVIAGLWDVSDESTPKLMNQLYAGITAGKPAAEALRGAKFFFIHSGGTYSRPFFWGPFQLYSRDAAR
ncbi:MAG: CHAT domain-containing protein [Acidobacteriota bacterium]|nr:CHAT domain-containing protein [Acidobacteriota bacterium]